MTSEAQRVARVMRDISHTDETALAKRFSELYDEQFEFVWRSARYLGQPQASIEDAVQDVFLVAYRRFREFEARAAPRTWLFAIALRVVSDHRRSLRRRTRLLESVKRLWPGSMFTPFDQASRAEEGRALLQALADLTEEQRAVFVMADLEELSAPDIARVLEVNLNTVYSRLRAARREMTRRLGPGRTESEHE